MKTLITTLLLLSVTTIFSSQVYASDGMIVASTDTSQYATFLAPAAKGNGSKQGANNQKRVDQATMAMSVKQQLTQVQENELSKVLENLKVEQATYLNTYLENSITSITY